MSGSERSRCVQQTTFADPNDRTSGNCTEAAVATLLDIPLEEVGYFYPREGDEISEHGEAFTFWRRFEDFFHRRGIYIWATPGTFAGDCLYLASGPSPRGGEIQHMVVMFGGELWWDPHPSGEGILHVTRTWVPIPRAIGSGR